RRTWVLLVRLNVIMAKQTLIPPQLIIRKFVRNQLALLVARIVALHLGEDRAERRRELDQRRVLLGRQVILVIGLALHHAGDDAVARGAQDDRLIANAAPFIAGGNVDDG